MLPVCFRNNPFPAEAPFKNQKNSGTKIEVPYISISEYSLTTVMTISENKLITSRARPMYNRVWISAQSNQQIEFTCFLRIRIYENSDLEK